MENMDKVDEHFRHSKFKKFKKFKVAMGIVLIALFAFLALNSIWDLFGKFGWLSSIDNTRTITLSAQGEATVSPDTARFTASVVTRGDSPKVVQGDNAELMNALIDYLKKEGIKKEDIKTSSYNLFPRYNYISGIQIPIGYELNQSLQVTVRDITKAGELLSGAVDNGANQVSSIQFFVDDPDVFKKDARQEAFDKARKKAEEMAKQAGVKIGKVVSFSESSGGYQPPIYLERSVGIGGGGGSPALEPGSQDIIVTVTVTYEIR